MVVHFHFNWLLALAAVTHTFAASQWTWRHPGPDWTWWKDMAVTDNAVYLVGQGAISRSTNGGDWTRQVTDPSVSITEIANSPNGLIAIGQQGGRSALFSSADGLNFSPIASVPIYPTKIAYAHGRYYLGGTPALSVSTDGVSWRTTNYPLGESAYDFLTVGDRLFIAEGERIRTTANGTNWTTINIPAQKLAYYNGLYAAASTGSVKFSVDGLNWDWSLSIPYDRSNPLKITALLLGHGGTIVVAHNNARTTVKAYFSADQQTWFSFVDFPREVEFGAYAQGAYFLANRSGIITTSPNGYSWTSPTNTSWPSLPNLTQTVSGMGQIVALGTASENGAPGFHSTNGVQWQPIQGIDGTKTIRAAAFGNNRFVAVGDSGTTLVSFTGKYWAYSDFVSPSDLLAVTHSPLGFVAVGRGVILRSDNGIRWNIVSNRLSQVLYSIAYGEGKFVVTTSGRPNRPLYSTNLTNWTELPLDYGQYATYGNGRFLMSVGNTIQISTDGITWQPAPPPPWFTHPDEPYPGLNNIHFSDGYFFARTQTQNYISTDGLTWHKLPSTPLTTTVSRHAGRFFAVGAHGSILESSGFATLSVNRENFGLNLKPVIVGDQSYQLQTSSDLQTWIDLPDAQATTLPLSTGPAPAKFFRLKSAD